MKKALIFVYGGGHSNIIEKIYPNLCNYFEVKIIALTAAEDYFTQKGITHSTLSDYLRIIGITKYHYDESKKFIKRHKIDTSKLGESRSVVYYAAMLHDYINQYGVDSLDLEYKEHGRTLFLPTESAEKIIRYERPDVVITTNSPRFERAAILASRNMGIVNFSIEDLDGSSRLFSPNDKDTNYYGDYICVLNDFVKEVLSNRGIDETKILVTGQPCLEKMICNESQLCSADFRLKHNIGTNERIICWASHFSEDEEVIFLNLVNKFEIDEIGTLVIKPHPNENSSFMEAYLDSHEIKKSIIIKDVDINELIRVSDVMLTQYSTCGLEAIINGTPLIVLNPNRRNYASDFSSMGLALNNSNFGNLKEDIMAFQLKNTNRVMEIYKNMMKFEVIEDASYRIVECIVKRV